jgi:large subunit ribosomal protein L22
MTKQSNNNKQIRAVGRYIRMSPFKVRRILNQIRGKTYRESLMLLEFMPYRACGPIWQLVYSAAANANHNFNLCKENLSISKAFANQGPIFRRFRLRAKGRTYSIRKPTCHIEITLR